MLEIRATCRLLLEISLKVGERFPVSLQGSDGRSLFFFFFWEKALISEYSHDQSS